MIEGSHHPALYWHVIDDGRIQCDLCPRDCKLHEGQRGACFVRKREGDQMVLTTYGRSSGFCVDPIEKKPLNHFLPGTAVLSFGTAGCNLACRFCQNWSMSRSRDVDAACEVADPQTVARAAVELEDPQLGLTACELLQPPVTRTAADDGQTIAVCRPDPGWQFTLRPRWTSPAIGGQGVWPAGGRC